MDCVHGNADDRTGWKIQVVDCNAARKDDTRKMTWNRCGAAKSFLDAGVEVMAGVELSSAHYFLGRAEDRAMRM
jgi:hypothetical protein